MLHDTAGMQPMFSSSQSRSPNEWLAATSLEAPTCWDIPQSVVGVEHIKPKIVEMCFKNMQKYANAQPCHSLSSLCHGGITDPVFQARST